MLVHVTLVDDQSRRTLKMTPQEATRLRTDWREARFNRRKARDQGEYEVVDDTFGTTRVVLPLSEASLLMIGRLLPQER